MSSRLRKTMATRMVLDTFMQDPSAEFYGLEVARAADLASGTLYPILARLEEYGLLASRNEDPANYLGTGRPPRRYYRLTDDGVEFAREALVGSKPRWLRHRASGLQALSGGSPT